MKTLKRTWLPLLATVFLCGCFQVEDDLTLQPDGSGKVTLTLHTSLPEELTQMLGAGATFGGGGAPLYPPASEGEARRFFPAKDFVLKVEQTNNADGRTLVIQANFKDVNALLASPYGRAHQLALSTNGNGVLSLRALSGGSTLAQAAQFKPEGAMAGFQMPGMEDAQKKKGEMRFQFRVSLPGPVKTSNGLQENNRVAWTAERAKCKDDEEFAGKLAGVLEATCSADAIQFVPVTPPRLGLVPFNELTAGKRAATTRLPDTNQILKAARFVPYALQVTRELDLSGEGGGQGSQAQLTGAILLPADLAPQRWGDAKLLEATDAKGQDLLPKEQGESFTRQTSFGNYDMSDSADEDQQDGSSAKKELSEKPHMIALNFKAPEWKVKRVARIRGVLDLQYLGGSEVVKLTNAVPAGMVMDMGRSSSYEFNSDSDRGHLDNSWLAELGFSLRVQMAMVQGGMTVLSLETGGGKAALVDAQVFDAQGRPWPTTFMPQETGGGGDHSCQLVVAGKPKPPFSLAIAVGGVGASVEVPILVENVPVGNQ